MENNVTANTDGGNTYAPLAWFSMFNRTEKQISLWLIYNRWIDMFVTCIGIRFD